MPPSPSRITLIKVCKSDVISPFERANLDRATHEVARNLPTIEPNPDDRSVRKDIESVLSKPTVNRLTVY